MAPTLLQIRQFQVNGSGWIPLTLPAKFDQLWISYTASLKLRSDPADVMSEYTCQITDGNLYRVVGGAALLTGQPIIHMQSVEGSQIVTAMTGQVQVLGGGGPTVLPPMAGHGAQFL